MFPRRARLPSLQNVVEGGVEQPSVLQTRGRVLIQTSSQTSVLARLPATNKVSKISVGRKSALLLPIAKATGCCALAWLAV